MTTEDSRVADVEIDALRAEVRRLAADVRRDLRERVAFLARELEETGAKVPSRISTS